MSTTSIYRNTQTLTKPHICFGQHQRCDDIVVTRPGWGIFRVAALDAHSKELNLKAIYYALWLNGTLYNHSRDK
jgi:hypothetical protein